MYLNFWTKKFWSDFGYGLSSGPFLIRRLIHHAQLNKADIIIELGAGRGQVTHKLIQMKSKGTRLIVIENDHASFLELNAKFEGQCELYEISAADIHKIVPTSSVDVIISTLPLGSMKDREVDSILTGIHKSLRIGGQYIQYQYALQNKKDVERYFHIKKISFELFNFWPAFIYNSEKK